MAGGTAPPAPCAPAPATASPAPPPASDPRAAALAGTISGGVASLCTHPLDVARTKLAVDRATRAGTPRYAGTVGTLRRVLLEEGRRGLFRGLSPALLTSAPAGALFFSVYTSARARAPPPPRALAHAVPAAHFRSGVAAACAWTVTCVALNPLFVLKTKQQTQLVRAGAAGPLKYAGLLPSARVVVREQGVRGLYAGTLAAVAGFPGAMVQMPLYEFLKGAGVGDEGATHRVAGASAVSAATVGLATYPVEVVRLRLQAQGPGRGEEQHYSGIIDGARKIFKNEGFRAFYRGCGTSLIRTVPQSAIALCSFETILRTVTAIMEGIQ